MTFTTWPTDQLQHAINFKEGIWQRGLSEGDTIPDDFTRELGDMILIMAEREGEL